MKVDRRTRVLTQTLNPNTPNCNPFGRSREDKVTKPGFQMGQRTFCTALGSTSSLLLKCYNFIVVYTPPPPQKKKKPIPITKAPILGVQGFQGFQGCGSGFRLCGVRIQGQGLGIPGFLSNLIRVGVVANTIPSRSLSEKGLL